MTAALLANLLAYSLQLAAMIIAAMVATTLWPLAQATWRHRFWEVVLAVGVLLPVLALWSDGTPTRVGGALLAAAESGGTREDAARVADWGRGAVVLVVAGVLARLAWLVVGAAAVCRYVRRAVPLTALVGGARAPAFAGVEVRVSSDVRSPTTVGYWRPIILLPPEWLALPEGSARAVIEHELAHVRRADWLRICAEEAWCSLLWFHPLVRLLVSRLDLAREMLIDEEVVRLTGDRSAYAAALLSFSRAPADGPSPVARFIRPRHLGQRITALSKEAPMSRRSLALSTFAVVAVVASAASVAVAAVPMPGAATAVGHQEEVFQIGDGVTAPRVTHEVRADYTKAALDARIQGDAWLTIVVQKDGSVGQVVVKKSLDDTYGLDEAAVTAMRQWRFVPAEKDGRPVAVEVTVEMRFTLRD